LSNLKRRGSFLAAICVAAIACGKVGDSQGTSRSSNDGGASSTGGASSGGVRAAGGAPNAGGSSTTLPNEGGAPVPPIRDAGALPDAELGCAESINDEVYISTLDFLFDNSNAMLTRVVGSSETLWAATEKAMAVFVENPAFGTVSAGLTYFPLQGAASCDPAAYAVPAVDIGRVSATGSSLVSSLVDAVPSGASRPLDLAFSAAINRVSAYAAGHSFTERHPEIVIVTSGPSTSCAPDAGNDVAALAKAAFDSPSHIVTHVIALSGTNENLSSLNAIASAGGSDHATVISGPGYDSALSVAFLRLVEAPIPCDLQLPAVSAGTAITPELGNTAVAYTSDQGAQTSFVRVNGPADCSTPNAWYGDTDAGAGFIHLCGSTCASLIGGRVTVYFGAPCLR
jgi:hypothetical protein